jgi:subtilase family serine protease
MNIARAAIVSATCTMAIVVSGSRGLANTEGGMSVLQVPSGANVVVRDLGRAPANYPVAIAVTLPYRNDSELEGVIQGQGDPDSPYYHHFLTPEQFAARYGPTASDELSIVQILERAGFHVTQRYANRTVIDAMAPALTAERYFKTEIHVVSESGVGVRYLNTRPARIPPELLARAFSVTGLNNIVIVNPTRPAYRFMTGKTNVGLPLQNEGGMGPLAWAAGYDLPVQHGYSGAGASVGEVAESLPAQAGSIQMYSFAFDLRGAAKPSTVVVPVNGGCEASDCSEGGGTENIVNEDADFLAALAPGVSKYLYQLPDVSTLSLEDGFNRLVAENRVDIATTFTTISEEGPNAEAFALTMDHIIRQGNALGITFVVETQLYNYGTAAPALTIPADSPHVLSVGESDLQVNKKGDYESEALWTQAGSGGEYSLWFPLPTYQHGIRGVQTNGRNAPDLASAVVAEVSTSGPPSVNDSQGGFFPYAMHGGWQNAVENSPAPFIALIADLDQMTKTRAGLVNTELYSLYKTHAYGPSKSPLFRDIVKWPSGVNARDLPGFDTYTGIGSVDGWNLIEAMKGKK